ncbi:hypothetical protein EGH24_09250 [Halonotius terrestris]|uniref:Uncharacterized protein n=1 Tax=Halonotius terrestris TaxID=2487750 RepID=A0A8J8PD59_9EURY|nr:hypothetical protein [Halonotius terrestris]TQQ81299.1 hypothetical protein EGH24_09250 [Halonotius terrestris]
MKRRTFILGGGTLITLSLGATATNASLQDTVAAAGDFRILSDPEPPTLATDPSTEGAESIHTWDVDFTNNDEDVTSITADYDFGTETASFDELSSDDVTVEFRQNGSLTTIDLKTRDYSGATATFEIADNTDTTAARRAKATIGTPENGLENPGDGTYTPTLTFNTASGQTETYEADFTARVNNAGAINVAKPTQDKDFTAVPDGNGNQFEIDAVDVRDDDGDDDLTGVNYEVREGDTNGTIVAQKSVNFTAQATYSPNSETIQPEDGYNVKTDQLYTLTTLGEDADGNYDSATVQDTSGNQASAIRIQDPSSNSDFTADISADEFVVENVDVRDDDGDDDLVEVYYEVHEGDVDGAIVGTKTVTFSATSRYRNNQNPEVIQSDSDYTLENDQLYTVVVQGRDIDDNTASVSVQDTTPTSNDPSAINIKFPSKNSAFSANLADNRFEIDKVTIEDDDNDSDLDEVEYEVYEGGTSGTVVATKTITLGGTASYDPSGQGNSPDETIDPGSYTIQSGQSYTLVLTARDLDSNFATFEASTTP